VIIGVEQRRGNIFKYLARFKNIILIWSENKNNLHCTLLPTYILLCPRP